MSAPVAWLLVLFGALLIAAGCQRPLDVAVVSANTAALTLKATHAEILAARKEDEVAAARRVKGDRADPAVRAEQADRALEVGRKYRPVWEAYDAARTIWIAVVAAIRVARADGELGTEDVERLLLALARAQREVDGALAEARNGRRSY